MVISDFFNARDAMQRLILQPMPLAAAYAVYRLAEAFDNVLYDFAQRVRDADDAEALYAEPVAFLSPIRLSVLTPGISLSPCDVKALSPFLAWEAIDETTD